jgi:hypothetical protein
MSSKERRATALDGVPLAAGAAAAGTAAGAGATGTGAGAGAAGAGTSAGAGAAGAGISAGAGAAGTSAGAGAAGAATSAGADVTGAGAAAGADVDGAGAGVHDVEASEGFAGTWDWALAVIQFHQPNGQDAAPAGAEPAVRSPPARTRVTKGAAMCLLSFRIEEQYLLLMPICTLHDAVQRAPPSAGHPHTDAGTDAVTEADRDNSGHPGRWEVLGGGTLDDSAVGGEAGAVAGAVPRRLGSVEADSAAQMCTRC